MPGLVRSFPAAPLGELFHCPLQLSQRLRLCSCLFNLERWVEEAVLSSPRGQTFAECLARLLRVHSFFLNLGFSSFEAFSPSYVYPRSG